MTAEEHDKQLQVLGLPDGPMGHRIVDGHDWLIYRMPDGSSKWLTPPDQLTDEQRAEQIEGLKQHLGIIEHNRRKNGTPGSVDQ